jgi:Acetyltransferase (GNAT) domain
MIIERYKNTKKDIWDDFILSSKNGIFMFRRDYMEYHADKFIDHSLMIYEEGKLISLLPANISNNVLYSHQGLTFGGFVNDCQMKTYKMLEIFSSLKDYLIENNFNKLIYKVLPHIYHKYPAEEDLYALFINNAVLFRTDVTTTISLDNKTPFSELRKRGAKKAIKNGIKVDISSDFNAYMNVLTAVLQENYQKKPVHSCKEIQLLASLFPENIKLFTAKREQKILAGVVVYEYNNIVHCQYIASSNEGKKIGALDAIFSYLINEFYNNKKYFDFGISTENNGLYLNQGLINQKEGFGGRAIVHNFFEWKIKEQV